MASKRDGQYSELARQLTAARAASRLKQSELAAVLGLKQQTVSRWEAGTHRPSIAQLAGLADAIRMDAEALSKLAGYAVDAPGDGLPLLPLDALRPAVFEQFTADLVEALHPEAEVRQQGTSGHEQEGADVVARFEDGTSWTFQCKRVQRFGPRDVLEAIHCHAREARRAFLVLSRIASPAAADEVAKHPGWTLWDRQDISRKVRKLAPDCQRRLVRRYFPNQAVAFLGHGGPGPWLTADEYFAPFRGPRAAISHDWPLAGRDADVERLVSQLRVDGCPAALLVGPGGIGKTRILKEAALRLAGSRSFSAVRFVSSSGEPGRPDLEELGAGRKLLVVDDAHDRDGLGVVYEFAADPQNFATLLLATRPYAEQRIRNELCRSGIVEPFRMRLNPPRRDALALLAAGVLEAFGAPRDAADAIAGASDSPLVAVMAARVLATVPKPLELAPGDESFRQVILSRFSDAIAGRLGSPAEEPLLQAALGVLALVQPFDVDDPQLPSMVGALHAATPAEVARGLKLLADGGVIYRRGRLWRLMPDLLGDFVVERGFLGADGKLTRAALDLVRLAGPGKLGEVLVNLGRLDWRLSGGDPSRSDLLAPVWAALSEPGRDTWVDARAVALVAIYQPAQALRFVQARLDAGQEPDGLVEIVKRVAYDPAHQAETLRLLWLLGRDDERPDGGPGRPLQALKDLAGYSEHKPVSFVEDVADFLVGLLNEPGAWSRRHDPLEALEPLLAVELTSVRWRGRSAAWDLRLVNHGAVARLRRRVVGLVSQLLEHDDPKVAFRAATFLQNALRFPADAPAELSAQYEAEFLGTVSKAAAAAERGRLAGTTLIGLASALSWHAHYGSGPVTEAARRVLSAFPGDLSFRLAAALADGSERKYLGQAAYEVWPDDQDWIGSLVAELVSAFPRAEELCAEIDSRLAELERAGIRAANGFDLLRRLVDENLDAARAVAAEALGDARSRLLPFLGLAIGALLDRVPCEGRPLAARALSSTEPAIRGAVAEALGRLRREQSGEDADLLQAALASDDATVAHAALWSLNSWRLEPREIVRMALEVRIDIHPGLVERVADLLSGRRRVAECLDDEAVQALLGRMATLTRIGGHGGTKLLRQLAQSHPERLSAFLFGMADKALDADRYDAMPFHGGPGGGSCLGLDASPGASALLRLGWDWLRLRGAGPGGARRLAPRLFASLFDVNSPATVGFLQDLLDGAGSTDLEWMGCLARLSRHRFPFEHRAFVEHYLERCKQVDRALVKRGVDQIATAAMTGSWSGMAGEPTPRDIEARDDAAAVLAATSRLSPSYRLYQLILESAEANIKRSRQDGAAMDAEE